MFSQVSVCPQGCLSLCPGGSPSWRQVRGLCPLGGGLCPGGLCPGTGGLCPGRGALSKETPPRPRPPYGNERAVRILLECILFYFRHTEALPSISRWKYE